MDRPRRAMGDLLGQAGRFGQAHDVMTAGEGIETILSLRMVLPHLPAAAALSAAHLSAILFPATLRRLYIARDDDPAGDGAMRSEEHTSELQSLMRISYAVFCLKKKKKTKYLQTHIYKHTEKHTQNSR